MPKTSTHTDDPVKNPEPDPSLGSNSFGISLNRHKPDILDCLANLSSDEVFTPPAIANKMLDLLPAEVWTNPSLKWLDPGCKTGVFLREAAKRLMVGLEKSFPDESERRDHIFRNMLYGIAITELTGLISRRTLYYTKDASSDGSVVKMDSPDGNIRYKNIAHTHKSGSCIHCGAPESSAVKDLNTEESHAYQFIHEEDVFGCNMKFDVIIGNPPYQQNTEGHGAQARPLYQKFVQKAIEMAPRYLSMIIPSRWFAGGMGLDEFREKMLSDTRLKELIDYGDASECFPGVEIKGGVCYFLWDKYYSGEAYCRVTNRNKSEDVVVSRKLDSYNIFVRNNNAISILEKVLAVNERSMSEGVSGVQPFGLPTNFKDFSSTHFENAVKLYVRGEEGWVSRQEIKSNVAWVDSWKVLSSMAYGAGEGFPHQITGRAFVAPPNSVCTMTYLVIARFKSQAEAESMVRYMHSRFFRFLVSLRKNTQHLTRDRFSFVPALDMSEAWDDAKLYARYGLTATEVAYIESLIKPIG